ncbi:hypothetical protein F183_A30660 [Bryobacterales bacterium F-183]|nr:hypothetical protein F183_A30660 [Bryobacterales bacterium F-183]
MLYFAVAYYVNPVRDFESPAGHPFPAVRSDYRNEKITLLESFIEAAPDQPVTGLVLGSSRSMLLNGDRLKSSTGLRFFNFGLASARGEDFLSALRWSMTRKGQKPKMVIIGVDVASLASERAFGDSIHPLRELATGTLSTFQTVRTLVPRLAEWSYAQSVLFSMYLAVRPREPLVGFAPDGTLQYRLHDRRRQEGTFSFTSDMAGCMATCRRKIESVEHLSPAQVNYLRTAVTEARNNGAEVVVWLTGPHPQTAQFMAVDTAYKRLRAEAQQVLHEVGNLGAHTYDLHDPSAYSGDPDGWYDCNHFDNRNAVRVEQIVTQSWRKH